MLKPCAAQRGVNVQVRIVFSRRKPRSTARRFYPASYRSSLGKINPDSLAVHKVSLVKVCLAESNVQWSVVALGQTTDSTGNRSSFHGEDCERCIRARQLIGLNSVHLSID